MEGRLRFPQNMFLLFIVLGRRCIIDYHSVIALSVFKLLFELNVFSLSPGIAHCFYFFQVTLFLLKFCRCCVVVAKR